MVQSLQDRQLFAYIPTLPIIDFYISEFLKGCIANWTRHTSSRYVHSTATKGYIQIK